ncbi:MAG TPA: TolC family outer membrane protein [Steroidobacteraceae bacterium]
MTRKSLLLACSVAAALVVGAPARAENLIDVYQAAVRSDPVLREAEMRKMAALEAKPQARGLLLPQVNVSGQYATRESEAESTFTQSVDHDDDETTPNIIVQVPNNQQVDSDFWTYEAQVTQSLFRWDQWQALKRADASVAVAEANYRAAQQDLLVRVSRAYFDVLAADDTLTAAQATLEALTRQLEQADKRFEVGLIAITDVQEARAAHDSATAGVIAAKRTLATTQEVLRELTNEAYTTLAKPAEQMPLDAPNPAAEQEWVDRALENNLSVIAARLETEVAARDVKVARSGHYPTVDLFASRNEFDSDTTATNNGLTGPADSNQTDDTIGVQVNIPIFSGGTTQSRVRESVYLQRAAREKLEGTMRSAERETRDAYLGVIAEKARVQALAQAVKSSQTALEATEAGFEVGTRTTVDVLASRRTLFEAQRDFARSRYDYLINTVRLESAAGGLVQDDLASINSFLTSPTTLPVVRPPSTPATTPRSPPPPPGG